MADRSGTENISKRFVASKPGDVVDIRVPRAWLRLLNWIVTNSPDSDISIRIAQGQPAELISVKRRIRFDKDFQPPCFEIDIIEQHPDIVQDKAK